MGSLFSKEPPPREPTPLERIGPEIGHLKNKTSVRTGKAARSRARWYFAAILCAMLWLYVMDPFLYAWHKYEAIQAYLYLHSYDSPGATQALIDTGILSPVEVRKMNDEHGSDPDYFSSPREAQQKAAAIVRYMKGLQDLHAGRYDQLDFVGKIRYTLFFRTGLPVPTSWSALNPSVN